MMKWAKAAVVIILVTAALPAISDHVRPLFQPAQPPDWSLISDDGVMQTYRDSDGKVWTIERFTDAPGRPPPPASSSTPQ